MQIDHELVRNQVIINHSIEQVILIANREKAMEVMYPPSNGPPPRNVRFCISTHPHRRGWSIRLVAGSQVRSDGIRPFEKMARIRTDTQAQMK